MFYKMLLLALPSFLMQPCLLRGLLVEDAPSKMKFGGASCFNHKLTWKKDQQKRGDDYGCNMFRLIESDKPQSIHYKRGFN